MSDRVIINPPTDNPYPNRAIEPPVWCAYMARHIGGYILDCQQMTVEESLKHIKAPAVFVAMGSNPSASSTPKMPAIERLIRSGDSVAGLHPQAMNDPRLIKLPSPELLSRMTPDWQDIDFTDYRAHNWHTLGQDPWGYGVIYTSFGCMHDCYYCNIHTLYGNRRVYHRNPADVAAELEMMVSKGVKHLKIADELFTITPGHVATICSILEPLHLNIWAYARVGSVSAVMLEQMKRAGINWLAIGFESASADVRKAIHKKTSDEQTFHTIRMVREAGISIIGNFMFGLPGDTPETMQATVDWAEEQNFEYVNYYVAMPYPGSQWYKDVSFGYEDWDEFSQFSKVKRASADVSRFRDEAFDHYFRRLSYLKMIQRKYGAAKEILAMLGGDDG